MNWVAYWHLCWVLLFLNGVTCDHETSPRPTSLKLPKQRRPLRSNNSIKKEKGPEGDFKFPEDALSTTASALSRLSSRRTTNVDYLARNTVPVASATETTRKSHRPPPSHLLAFQAVSTTERGSDRFNESSLSPTGWAVASLFPSKNATPPFPKRNTVVSGTAKPFNTYWSAKLRRPVARTTPITPTDVASWVENEKNVTDSVIPVENLVKHENLTSSHDSPKREHDVSWSDSQSTERSNYLEKPSYSDLSKQSEDTTDTTTSHHRKQHGNSTTAHHPNRKHHPENTTESHHRGSNNSSRSSQPASSNQSDSDQNAGSNLIKEVKGVDLGSSVLNGITGVLATAASRYTEDYSKQEQIDSEVPELDTTNETTSQKSPDSSLDFVNSTTQNSSEVANIEVPIVTLQPEHQETASSSVINITFSGNTFTANPEDATSRSNVTTIPTSTVTDAPDTESSPEALGEIVSPSPMEKVTNKMANLLENFISPTTPSESASSSQSFKNENDTTAEVNSPSSKDYASEYSTPSIATTDSVTETAKAVTKRKFRHRKTTTSAPIHNTTTESLTTTLSNGLLEPRSQREKLPLSPTKPKESQEISATTLSLEVNDIPEAFTRVKDPSNLPSSSQGTDNVLLPTSTLPPATTAEPKPVATSFAPSSSTVSTMSPQITTSPNNNTPVTTIFLPANATDVDDQPTTTTELTGATDQSTITETGIDSSPPSTDSKVDRISINNETETPTTTTEPLIIIRLTTARSEDKPPTTTTENTSEIVETTSLVPPKSSSIRPSSTTTAPPRQTTIETTLDITSTKRHFEPVVTEKGHIPVDTDDDHDDTLKYNVTNTDISDKKNNGTEQEDYNDGDKDEDENEKENEVPTTTTLVIIEEMTTKMPSTRPTTKLPKTTTRETPSTTYEATESDVYHTTEVPVKLDDSETDQRLRLTFQASYKEICLVRDSLTESLTVLLKEAATSNIRPSQVRILNLGMTECSSKVLPLADKVPVILQITDREGKSDQNLTDLLYTYLKQGRLNFKYQVSNVEMEAKSLLMEEEEQWGGTVVAAIVVSSVAGVSLCCITILLMIMRKRQKGFTSYGQRCTPVSLEDYSLDNISVFNSVRRKAMRASKRSYGNPAFDDPVTVTNPLNFVGLSNMANSHTKIDTEYSEVPTVSVKPDELPLGAESKNRYANVIPIPETRVPLSGSEREEVFINANYVKGAKGAEKFYIACQAPLDSTIADFWMMIWEQQTQVILMLTDLHENGVEKCADYLPPSEVLDCHRVFGDLQVTLKKREVREKYVISSLQLRNLESNLWREVNHLWYTGWPIRGVPDDLTSIIAYLIEARSYSKPGHPIVVHCSPGTGRTGTVIAIDIAIRDFETDRIVDIPKTVYSIRRDRAGSVQTNLQYYLIYQVIHLYATKLAGGGLDSI
ncbi:hypothetical protein GE061_013883 [Apolygus lucorum]|uniref:protein-tyrosine-phosphatase n=1 Tax=Apolygus lucorum TaxID=248454 RepID=A0A6A4K9J2_APOLU|nr:hypothetical protein GE061_013883 [Apolygus lucorum]